MRSLIRWSVLLSLMFATPAFANEYLDTIQAFFTTVKAILTGGTDLFNTLATDQVKRVTRTLASQAADIENEKITLREEIVKEKDRDITVNEVDHLVAGVNNFAHTLEKFAEEIDHVGGAYKENLHVVELRQASSRLANVKLQELEEIRQELMKPNPDRPAILEKLDKAIAHAHQLRDITLCLQRTLENEKLACDPDTVGFSKAPVN